MAPTSSYKPSAVKPVDFPDEPGIDQHDPPDVDLKPRPSCSSHSNDGARSKPKKASPNLCLQVSKSCSGYLRPVQESSIFKVTLAVALFFALFGGSLWTVCNVPDDPGTLVLDILMLIVTLLFILEMLINMIVDITSYPLSFFFWMDLLGTVSMAFEISFMLGTGGKIQTSKEATATVLQRTARAARIGARVGRLSKLVKWFSQMFLEDNNNPNGTGKPAEAKVLSNSLMFALSSKVSLLTTVLVVIVPMFAIEQFPGEDLSMKLWAQKLESDLRFSLAKSSAGGPAIFFNNSITEMVAFYSDSNYGPYKLQGFGEQVTMSNGQTLLVTGSSILHGVDPLRKSNIYRQEVPSCLVQRTDCDGTHMAAIYFTFEEISRVEAACDMGMVMFIILVMLLVSVNLNQTLDRMVVKPMERMLGMVKSMAADVLKQFGLDEEHNEGGEAEDILEETELIESIFKKFARLATLAAGRNETTEEELANMDAETKGVMMDMMNVQAVKAPVAVVVSDLRSSRTALSDNGELDPDGINITTTKADVPAVSHLPVSKQVIDSWDLDVVSFDTEGQTKIALHIFFDSRLGASTGRAWTQVDTFHRFHSVIKSGYNDLPYHNYAHACDVLHTVYRLLVLTRVEKWLSSIEQYALLVAALCHDVGHAGKTNPFLVETVHELAVRYNDKSPLENMHCAKLFEVCSHEETDVFKKADKDTKKQARRVCIAAILHTDNANHFEMVRDISKIYELSSEVCDSQAKKGNGDLASHYVEQVLQKNSLLWMELFLHFADVSNPLKPFEVCHKWAWRVLEEFFDQGDEEKLLGIPVGMLNDRDKINRPGSQHGFINFLVAPLVATTVKLFPVLHPLYSQMASNLDQWKVLWIEDAKPSPEDIAKKEADVNKIKDTAKELERRFGD